MKWSWTVGKIANIDLKIHPTFALIFIYVGFSAYNSGASLGSISANILLIMALFLCVVMHELGHALMARKFGIATHDITLLPIGGVARLERMPEDPKEEFLVAIAGPAVNVIIGSVLFTGILFSGLFAPPFNPIAMANNFWVQLLATNILLVLFNLIPAFPMDGGRVLRALLATRVEHVKATQIAANIGRSLAILFGIAGIFTNPWLVITAIFVWTGAGAEAQAVRYKANLQGLVVRDALITQFYHVEANQPLSSVFQLTMETGQAAIPVLSNGNFLGVIHRAELLKAIDQLGNRAAAYSAIDRELKPVHPEMPLVDILPKFTTSRVLPVTEERQLLGLVSAESVQQRMWMNQRLKRLQIHQAEEKTDMV